MDIKQAKKQIKGTPVKEVLFLSRPKNLDYLQKIIICKFQHYQVI